MKYKDYKFTTAKESIDLTYDQACEYFEETLTMVEHSKFDLFDENEELSLEDARKKYNETNRRLQTFGQAFELFMKYIIHASRLEKNPNLKTDELWNKWIRGHQMIPLINEKANSPEVLPNFKEIFNLAMNSYYRIFGTHYIKYLGNEAIQGRIDPTRIFQILLPTTYSGYGSISNEEIEEIIDKNTAIYEKCRYNIEAMRYYNFFEVFYFVSFVKFFAKMIKLSNDKTEIDYNVAYVHAMCDDPVLSQIISMLKPKEEIEEILNDELCNKNAKFLAYMLTRSKYPLKEVKKIALMDEHFGDLENLCSFLAYDIPLEYINKCHEEGINVMLLTSPFTFEEIVKLSNIPSVGEYLNKNDTLVSKMVTTKSSNVGLTFDDWYKILTMPEVIEHPECLKMIITNYKQVYNWIEKNNLCNSIFGEDASGETGNLELRDNRKFNERYLQALMSNIRGNFILAKNCNISIEDFPVTIDSNNAKKIIDLANYLGIIHIPIATLVCPFNEFYAVTMAMKNRNYDFTLESFPKDFWEEYDKHAAYNIAVNDYFIFDEFLEDSGLIRKSSKRYCSEMYGWAVSTNSNNPLPNLKQ